MKLWFGAALLLLTAFVACKSGTGSGDKDQNEKDLALYKQAMSYNDYITAATAIHSLMLRDSNNTSYNDTLVKLYFNAELHFAAIKAADKVLQNNPRNVKVLEMAAKSAEYVRSYEHMMDYSQRLLQITEELKYNYQMAVLYINRNRIDSGDYFLQTIINSPRNISDSVDIMVAEGYTQRVPAKAAALNAQGFLKLSDNRIAEARNLFKQSLEISPDFELSRKGMYTINGGK
jgi:tetratricopeptide (TPR) repeat protein